MSIAVSSEIVAETIVINSIIMIKAGIEQRYADREKKAEHFRLFEQQIALMIYYFQGCGQMTPREASKLIKVVKLAAGENGWRKKKETDEEESDDKEQENKETDTNKEETK